jgi:hypothetical protein
LGFAKNEAKRTRILIPGKLYKKLWNSEFFIEGISYQWVLG